MKLNYKIRRLDPKLDWAKQSPNYSTRSTNKQPRLIVIHDTETDSFESVMNWLSDPASDASCHAVVNTKGTSGRLVSDKFRAWHCAGFNDISLGIEQCGYSTLGKLNWLKRERELTETARWVAHWSIKFGIPIRHVHPEKDGITIKSGVTMHKDLGEIGGGHEDPGDYPIKKVLVRAIEIKELLKKA